MFGIIGKLYRGIAGNSKLFIQDDKTDLAYEQI